jgi:RimJ/RimL family protein N-acetyltransferase
MHAKVPNGKAALMLNALDPSMGYDFWRQLTFRTFTGSGSVTQHRSRSNGAGRLWTDSSTSSYNAEMKHLMLRHAFKFVDRVVFLVGPQNHRSQRALEKLRAVRVASRSDAGGRESFVYQIIATEYGRRGTGAD